MSGLWRPHTTAVAKAVTYQGSPVMTRYRARLAGLNGRSAAGYSWQGLSTSSSVNQKRAPPSG